MTVALALAVAAPLAACSSGADDAATDLSARVTDQSEAAPPPLGDGDMDWDDAADVGVPAESAATDRGGPGTGFDIGTIGRDVAIEMRVTVRTDDVRATVEGIGTAAAARGGGIASSDIDFGTDERPGWATIVVKVPPSGIDGLLGRLDQLGEVVSVRQDAVDVTDQLVDLDVRISNATQSVDRVRALLADASDLREVIDLESELTRRQTELERLLATQRNLQERVALATLTIEVVASQTPIEPVVDPDPGLLDGLRTGWDGFVAVLFGLAYAVAVMAPAIVLAGAGLVIAWLLVRRRRGSAPGTPGARGPDGTGQPHDVDDMDDVDGTDTTGDDDGGGLVTSGGRTTPAP